MFAVNITLEKATAKVNASKEALIVEVNLGQLPLACAHKTMR